MSDKVGLSDGFVYMPKPGAAPAANIRVSVPTANKDVFKLGNETMSFSIPSGKRGQYLNTRMSYLKFTVDCTMKNDDFGSACPILALDGGAHALFNSLELYHGTNLLEQIREYNTLYQTLLDVGADMPGVKYGMSVGQGCFEGKVRMGKILTPVAFSSGQENDLFQHNRTGGRYKTTVSGGKVTAVQFESVPATKMSGVDMSTLQAQAEILEHSAVAGDRHATFLPKTTVSHTFCIPLVSGIVGGQMGKYIPVGALAADLRLELGLADFNQSLTAVAVGATTGSAHTIKNDPLVLSGLTGRVSDTHDIVIRDAELMLEYIEVAADVQTSIEATTGGQYIMSFDSFACYTNAIPKGQAAFAQLIGARFSSLKTAIAIFRDSSLMTKIQGSNVTSRVNPFSTAAPFEGFYRAGGQSLSTPYAGGVGWYYAVGATHYPPKPIESHQEAYFEMLKSQHVLGAQTHQNLLNNSNWVRSARIVEGENGASGHCAKGGTFLAAQNLESQSHKAYMIESGVNTLAQHIYLHARFPPASDLYPGATVKDLRTTDMDALVPSIGDGSATQTTVNASLQIDHFMHYDGILIINKGICSTRF